MLISPAPIVIPVNTANISTEAARAEAVQRPRIPQPAAAADSARSKDSKTFSDQQTPTSNASTDAKSSINSEREQGESPKDGDENESATASTRHTAKTSSDLNQQEIEQVTKLRNRDREVRNHEQAHASAGGSLAGAPSLDYTTGPDGKRYATSGEVSIDSSPVAGDPKATIQKLQQVQAAALAPANPSSQDQKVAAQAASGINQARVELNLDALAAGQGTQENASVQSTSNSDSQRSGNQASDHQKSALNPIYARRQAAQLNQKIATSGALDIQSVIPTIAIRV
ncbi:MAG: putative metalloprotease CJM1_0395 family protein [Enterobacterales bacterium]|nr:putative metalloprotease CJM1_0395 family protein [Enterobacterales bacterium]